MEIHEHEPLNRHTTLRTGGPARHFLVATTTHEVIEAVAWVRARALPLFILGGGSNVLAADPGFPGAVIHIASQGVNSTEQRDGSTEIMAEAGVEWDALVARTVRDALVGLENLSLIPGTVGGAVVGNIGAYGTEIKDSLCWADVLDIRNGDVRRFSAADCQFGYRHSFFKSPEGRHLVVLRAAFGLRRDGPLNLRYQDLRDYFQDRAPTLAGLREAIIAIRRRKLPDPGQVGTAGSFFKNWLLSRAVYAELQKRYPGLPGHPEGGDRIKVPLGYVLDKICGLKGARLGRVSTHSQQALVLVNEGGTATEIAAFARLIADRVRECTHLPIEWEVEKLGDFSQ